MKEDMQEYGTDEEGMQEIQVGKQEESGDQELEGKYIIDLDEEEEDDVEFIFGEYIDATIKSGRDREDGDEGKMDEDKDGLEKREDDKKKEGKRQEYNEILKVEEGKLNLLITPILQETGLYDYDAGMGTERPWREPGADITDWFNFGFTEQTWHLYCVKQKVLREKYNMRNITGEGRGMMPPELEILRTDPGGVKQVPGAGVSFMPGGPVAGGPGMIGMNPMAPGMPMMGGGQPMMMPGMGGMMPGMVGMMPMNMGNKMAEKEKEDESRIVELPQSTTTTPTISTATPTVKAPGAMATNTTAAQAQAQAGGGMKSAQNAELLDAQRKRALMNTQPNPKEEGMSLAKRNMGEKGPIAAGGGVNEQVSQVGGGLQNKGMQGVPGAVGAIQPGLKGDLRIWG
ncbi:Pre-mRNA polyadenylation factor FIP1 [Zancudomyces culisetae]|nr:Pre-mRNA polyadenylation factor FIP1 [Zancudomyces culisetae]|eukprot:OMH85413.1 Pre-mRNA polyadenylation factor FIP1 [Zancudomyces culisetae]